MSTTMTDNLSNMGMDEIDTCKVCMETYNAYIRPRSLNCGHSFCSFCLNNIITHKKLPCPKCQRPQQCDSSHDFPINYDLEEMISKLRETQMNATQKPPSRDLSSKMKIFLEEQMDNAENLLQKSGDVLSLLTKYMTLLLETKDKHRELLPKIYELASRNEDAVNELDAEHSRIAEIHNEGEIFKEELNVYLTHLESDYTISGIDDLDKSYAVLENWNKDCQQGLPKATTITSSNKLLYATTEALSVLDRESDEEQSDIPEKSAIPNNLDSLSADSNKVDSVKGCKNLTLRRLRNNSELTKGLIENDRVYAVQQHKGFVRCAKVSLKNNNMYLHYLRDEDPPISSYIIEQNELVETLTSESVMAFMDLAWNGTTQGRVHILLTPETPLAHQFRILCTGEQGPSYAHCKFLEVAYKSNPSSQALRTGDYEFNDGTGGAALVTELKMDDERYSRPHVAGIVWASFSSNDGPQSTQFYITTGSYDGNSYQRVFGLVQDGLDVVKAAAEVEDIQSVRIVDCGVILPLNDHITEVNLNYGD